MSTLTNVHGLPDPVVRALSWDGYGELVGDISVTGLLRPVQVAALEERHKDELPPEDVSERIWRLYGSAAHEFLYRSRDKDAVIAEQRLTMDVAGWTVSGKPDTYDTSTQSLTDFKTSSVWTAIFDPTGRSEWHAQLNCYRVLLEQNGYPVKALQVILICRDWNKKESLKRPDYPKIPIVAIDIPLWDIADAQAYMARRVLLHQAARETGKWADCTPEERWQNARTGAYARCEGYCAVSSFCPTLAREAAGIVR